MLTAPGTICAETAVDANVIVEKTTEVAPPTAVIVSAEPDRTRDLTTMLTIETTVMLSMLLAKPEVKVTAEAEAVAVH